jgi:hypothetical protein
MKWEEKTSWFPWTRHTEASLNLGSCRIGMNRADGGDLAIELFQLRQHQTTDFFRTQAAMQRFANGRT